MAKVQNNLYPCGCVSYGKQAPQYCPEHNKYGTREPGRITYSDYQDLVDVVGKLNELVKKWSLPPAVR